MFVKCLFQIHSLRDEFEQSESINQFIEQSKCKMVIVFMDGSINNSTVGCGSCASALFPLLESEEVIFETSVV